MIHVLNNVANAFVNRRLKRMCSKNIKFIDLYHNCINPRWHFFVNRKAVISKDRTVDGQHARALIVTC